MAKLNASDPIINSIADLLEIDVLSFEDTGQFSTLCHSISKFIPNNLMIFYLKKPEDSSAIRIAQHPPAADQEIFITQIDHTVQLAISLNEELFQKTMDINKVKQHFLGVAKKFQDTIFTIVLIRPEAFSDTESKILKTFTHILAANTLFNGIISSNGSIIKKRTQYQSQNDFISTIAHDIRNPLGSIKGYVTTLLRNDIEWPENTQKQFLQTINKASDRLSEMITNFLETSRLQSGDYDLYCENIPSSDLLNELLHYNKINYPNFTLHTSFPHNNPIIYLDKRKLMRVIQSLIENAIKHANISEIWINIANVPNSITIDIEDHGDGIPESRIKGIFNNFSQITPCNHGSGLSLYICKEIVNRHKGKVSVHSTRGKGTTFIISLPLSPLSTIDQDL